jgi:hypothetical protein
MSFVLILKKSSNHVTLNMRYSVLIDCFSSTIAKIVLRSFMNIRPELLFFCFVLPYCFSFCCFCVQIFSLLDILLCLSSFLHEYIPIWECKNSVSLFYLVVRFVWKLCKYAFFIEGKNLKKTAFYVNLKRYDSSKYSRIWDLDMTENIKLPKMSIQPIQKYLPKRDITLTKFELRLDRICFH